MCKDRTCGTCAIKQLQGGICPVFKREVSDDDAGCIIHATELSKCDFCGRVAFGKLVISPTDDGKYRYVCEDCCSLFGTCRTCEYGKHSKQGGNDKQKRNDLFHIQVFLFLFIIFSSLRTARFLLFCA
jgi:hypothetical protein